MLFATINFKIFVLNYFLRPSCLSLSGLIFLLGCTPQWQQKINFELSQLDGQGLRRGEVAVSYEICIPHNND